MTLRSRPRPGLHLSGAAWSARTGTLCESAPRQLFCAMPVIQLVPRRRRRQVPDATDARDDGGEVGGPAVAEEAGRSRRLYECPVYRTPERRGELSTTGHSTNCVMALSLPIPPDTTPGHWVLRGAALLADIVD